mgnify:CR=1 FL=1
MKITIDEDACKKSGLSLPEVLVITLIKTGVHIQGLLSTMIKEQKIVEENTLYGIKYLVTQRWSEECDKVLLSADKEVPKEDRIQNLAKQLMDLFPKGKKAGTSQYWKGNTRDITLRLSKFFKLYGNKYSDEQIITATKNYIDSFNGDYRFMRVLKYFIWKNVNKINSEGVNYIEECSDLANFIENSKDENSQREDWLNTLI